MAVDEAPWLTTRVVAFLMVVVFFLCLAADQFQCSKNGRQYFCSGKAPYYCDWAYCREGLSKKPHFCRTETCMYKGTAEVIFAFVEVGPSLVSEHGKTVSAYMAEELRTQIDSGSFPSVVSDDERTNHNNIMKQPSTLVVDEFYKLSNSLWRLRRIPPYVTRYFVANDVVPLPLYQHRSPYHYLTWDEAVAAVLPTSKVDNATQLKAYFPNLHANLSAAVARRRANAANSTAACDSVSLVVYTFLSPLASVRTAWDFHDSSMYHIDTAYSLVAGAVTRYITTNRRIWKHLDEVIYAHLYVSLPSRQFKAVSNRVFAHETELAPEKLPLTANDAVAMAAKDLSASLAFCNATTNASRATECLQRCEHFLAFSSTAARVDPILSENSQRYYYYGIGAYSPLYRNCYFYILGNGSAPFDNGTFGVREEARLFDDCLHLSPAGGKALASCLLQTRTRTQSFSGDYMC